MAIYGIGAFFEEDVSTSFIEQNFIGTGWNENEAPGIFNFIRSLKVGDIVYIKAAFGGNDITVKAVGIIQDNAIIENREPITIGRNVAWLDRERFVIERPVERNNVRSNTIYEEFNPIVTQQILNRIIP